MTKPAGRTDDMLIIRGVNVFPSQVESVLMDIGDTSPYYMMIVEREGLLDTLEIQVEIGDQYHIDDIKSIQALEKKIRSAVESTLGIAAKIKLVEPRTLPRSEGKAKHVIDKRTQVNF